MFSDNICKFITNPRAETLTTRDFVFEQKAPPSAPRHTLGLNAVYLVAQGEGRLLQGETVLPLGTGNLFFTFAGYPFSIENTEGLQYLYITFEGGRSEELFRRFGISPAQCLWEGMGHLLPLWQDSLMRADEENVDLLSESLVLYTLSKLKSSRPAADDFTARVLGHLERHFTEQEVSLGQVARALGYNEKYLSHAFKQQFGMNFSAYLRLMRIKHAALLMENGVTSVKNVAFLSGFSDPLYFSKVFSGEMGCSPKAYLAKLRKK